MRVFQMKRVRNAASEIYELDKSFGSDKVVCPQCLKCFTFSVKKEILFQFFFVSVFVN
jgi:hypothetical protein